MAELSEKQELVVTLRASQAGKLEILESVLQPYGPSPDIVWAKMLWARNNKRHAGRVNAMAVARMS